MHELSEMKSNLDRARETNASLDNEVRALEHGRTQEQDKVQLLQARLEKNSQNEELVAHDMQASNCVCFVLMYLYSLSHFCEIMWILHVHRICLHTCTHLLGMYMSIHKVLRESTTQLQLQLREVFRYVCILTLLA